MVLQTFAENRPELGDQALPLCYGDLIMLSCTIGQQGVAYLCEEGCVMKDPEVPMKASSRELTFEVCVASDARALHEINAMLRKYGIPTSEKVFSAASHLHFPFSAADSVQFERLLKKRETDESAVETYAKQMKGRPVTYGDLIQLKHTQRQAFLGIDVSQAPKVEASCKKVVLSTALNAAVRFKILPRFKYLAEGNSVCFGDNISLLSVDHDSEFLHTSLGFATEEIGIVYEVNLSRDRTTIWSLECFFRCNSQSEHCVKAGDVVRLYHSFCDGFVAVLSTDDKVGFEKSDDSSSMSSTMWVVEDEATIRGGLLRTLRSFTLMHLVSKKYMVIEGTSLDPAYLGPSRTDFSDKERGNFFSSVTLEKHITPDASLLLHSPEDSNVSSNVCWGSRFRMVHAGTSQYLHVTEASMLAEHVKDVNVKDVKRPSNRVVRSSISVLVASPALFREDSFEIRKVPDDQVQAVETLSRMLPVLREYRDSLETALKMDGAEFPQEKVVDIIEQLESLTSFVYTGSSELMITGALKEDSALNPIAFCQNFMRDLCVADLLMDILRHICNLIRKQKYLQTKRFVRSDAINVISKIPMSELVTPERMLEYRRNRSAMLICEKAYDALLHMIRKHKQNATYLARYLDDIQEQLILKVGAENVLLEMLSENEVLLSPDNRLPGQSPFHKRHIKFHIDALVREGKDPMHLSFLSAMVAIGDQGIELHQDLVLPELINYKADIVLDIQVKNQAVQLRDPQHKSDMENQWTDLSIIATGAGRQGGRAVSLKRMLEYWQEYLLLLAKLCKPGRKGRRDFLVRKVQSLVQCDICVTCLQDDSLPNHLRWTVCELLRVAFVEQDDFMKVGRSAGVAIWNDLDQVTDSAYTQSEMDGIDQSKPKANGLDTVSPRSHEFTRTQSADLKKTVMEYFQKQAVHYYPPRVDFANRLKMSILRLCRQLVLFGHFHFSELEPVMKIAHSILDFSNLRIEDAEQAELSQALHRTEASEDSKAIAVSELSEQSITCALRQLRTIVGEFPPLEVARLQCTFAAYKYEIGDIIVHEGHPQEHMFVIQSGSAFTVKTTDGVESVVGTLGAGQMFGTESLTGYKPLWPWQVRCSSKLIVLAISRSEYQSTMARLVKNGPTTTTDGLVNIFNMQRESCLIINDIYDLRLQVRARRLLQEYRFDVNISSHPKYCAAQLVAQKTSVLNQFPKKPEFKDMETGTQFRIGNCLVFGPFSSFIVPMKKCFCGVLRIDKAVILISMCQLLVATLIVVMLSLRLATNNSAIIHPGPSQRSGAVVVNLVATGLWWIANVLEAWSAFTLWPRAAHICCLVQLFYLAYFIANTSAGLIEGATDQNIDVPKGFVQSQAIWLGILTPCGVYSSLAFASLSAIIENSIFFTDVQNSKAPTAPNPLPPQKFLKALDFFDLDQDGMFSRTLTDLFVSRFRTLVVDAFCLLVRTHDSVFELYRELSGTLLLTGEDSKDLYSRANKLTQGLLDATNAVQADHVDRPCKSRADLAMGFLQEILTMIDDKAPIVQRRLFQRLGLHRVVLRLLASLREDHMQAEGSLCYSILAGLCDGNQQVKSDAAECIEIFMLHLKTLPRMVVMLLASIFYHNSDQCEMVDESMIERVVSLLKVDLDECYLILLRVIAAPNEQEPPLRRNQNLIMKFIGNESGTLLQMKQLLKSCQKKDKKKSQKSCAIYIALLELLVVCMAENNVDAKKRCRGGNQHLSLPLTQIEEQLRDRSLPNRIKNSLLGFMEEAYIRVEFTARSYLFQPELCRIFDHYSRHVQTLLVDQEGSKLGLLTKSERELLMTRYLNVMLSFFSCLSASDFGNADGQHARLAIHLLECFSGLVLIGPSDSHRVDCSHEEELRILKLVQALTERLKPHNHERYQLLQSVITQVLGSEAANEVGMYQREMKLRQDIAEETAKRQREPLDVPSGVKAFADEFMHCCSSNMQQLVETTSERAEAQSVSSKLLDSLRQLQPISSSHGSSEASGPMHQMALFQERTSAPFSDMCLDSLVDLMEAAVTSTKFLPVKLCMTGLYILRKVAQSVPISKSAAALDDEGTNRRKWFDVGIPGVVIESVSAPNVLDVVACECISIAIVLLERGKSLHQKSFHDMLQGHRGAVFFGALRDRLMRAERGLTSYQSLFWSKAQELAIECEAHGRILTIAGIRDVCDADRLSKSFVGSHPAQVLRLLQLFCEGHNRQMQEYIRSQGQNSADLVACTADFLVSASRQMHLVGVSLVLQCIDTLIEFVQNPCPANQRALVDSQLPHVLNHLLQANASLHDLTINFEDMPHFQEQTEQVKTKTVTLLLSLLERVDGPFIPSRILEALEIDNLVREINTLYDQYCPLCKEERNEEENLVACSELSANGSFQVACSLFMLLSTLRHYDTDGHHQLAVKCTRRNIQDMVRLRANCGFVEISRDGQLERIFFQIPSICRFLTPEAKENIRLSSAEANNHQDKMLYFVRQAHARYEEMVHLQGLTSSLLYRIYTSVSGRLEKLFFFNALLLNLLFIGGYRYPNVEWSTLSSMQNIILPDSWRWGILVLSILQLILSVIRFVGYYVDQGILKVRRKFNTEAYVHVYTELYGGPRFYYLFFWFLLLDNRILILFTFVLANVLALGLHSVTSLSFLFLG